VIRVGGQTETEIEERTFRVDDAVAAAKAAMAEGILPGGGIVLYNAPLKGKTAGSKLLKEVLQEPFKQLLENSGLTDVAMPNMDRRALAITSKLAKSSICSRPASWIRTQLPSKPCSHLSAWA
jgi:chaperonin GroEL (HSP60 family)